MVFGPIGGAFVEPDEKLLAKRSRRVQLGIFAAGPFSNLASSVIFLLFITFILAPVLVSFVVAEQFGAPALLTRYSRLLIDPNRGIDDPTLIMQISDGVVVPGNAGVGEQERQRRIARYYQPYHRAIDEALEAAIKAGRPPVLLSMHSFTQAWKSVKRPWDVTVLWDKDPRLARPLLRALEALPGLVVGENVPYTGKLRGDTVYRHGTRRGLAHALIEIRQDLLLSPEGQAEWAGHFAGIVRRLLSAPDLAAQLAAIEYHGSHADSPADTTRIVAAREAPHG